MQHVLHDTKPTQHQSSLASPKALQCCKHRTPSHLPNICLSFSVSLLGTAMCTARCCSSSLAFGHVRSANVRGAVEERGQAAGTMSSPSPNPPPTLLSMPSFTMPGQAAANGPRMSSRDGGARSSQSGAGNKQGGPQRLSQQQWGPYGPQQAGPRLSQSGEVLTCELPSSSGHIHRDGDMENVQELFMGSGQNVRGFHMLAFLTSLLVSCVCR